MINHSCPVLPVIVPPPIIPPTQPGNTSYVYCPSGRRATACSQLYSDACGFRVTGLPQDYANGCQACADPNVTAYISGSCASLLKTCPAQRTNCRYIGIVTNQSCGFEKNKAPVNVTSNFCCINTTYSEVITGACPTIAITAPSVTICTTRTTICYQLYLPVCGTYYNGTTSTFANDCIACSNKLVASHIPGACSS